MNNGREILPTHELNKSPIGPLWLGRILDAGGELDSCGVEDLCLVRRLSQAKSDDAKAGLEAAVAAAQNLDHPNILPLLEYGETDKEIWLASQYLAGENLRSLMRLSGIGRKPAPEAVALKLVADVLEALSYLHASQSQEEGVAFAPGPDRIWLTRDGSALLMTPGFGVLLAKTDPWARIAKRACYDAPESFGESPVHDVRSDVFAAGVLLWELLRNRQLFSGSSYSAVQQRVTSGAIRRVDSLKPSGGEATSKAVADIVARAVARDPEARFESPAEMLAEIRAQAVAGAAEVADYCNGLLADSLKKQARRVEQATAGAPVSSRRGRVLASAGKALSRSASAAGKKSKSSAASELLNAPDSLGEETVKVGRKAISESSLLSLDGGPSSGDDWDESTLKVQSKLQLSSDGEQPLSADGWDESTLKVAKSESADKSESESESESESDEDEDEDDTQSWDESTLQVAEQPAPDASPAPEAQASGKEGDESTAEDAVDEEVGATEVSEAPSSASAAAALMSPAATGAADFDMLSIADDPSIEEELPEVARRALAAVADGNKDDSKTNVLPIVLVLLLVGAVFMMMRNGSDEPAPAASGTASTSSVPPHAGTAKSTPSGTAAPKTGAASSAGTEAQASPSASAADAAASAEPEPSASAAEKKAVPPKTTKAPVKMRMPKRRRRPRVRPKPRKRSDFTPSDI